MKACEGKCDKHVGDVKRYMIVNDETGSNWGLWWYCEAAVHRDRDNGLTVTERTQDGQM